MIVVLCSKVQVIHQPHGLFQPRVQHGAGEHLRLKFSHPIDESQPRLAEVGQNVRQQARTSSELPAR
jgi:hypothetical protein